MNAKKALSSLAMLSEDTMIKTRGNVPDQSSRQELAALRKLEQANREIAQLQKKATFWRIAAIVLGVLFCLTLALKLAL